MSAKQKNGQPARPKACAPRGFRDRLGAEIIAEREMLASVSRVYEAHGFDPLETPALEFTDALGKFLPDIDRPGQGVFSLQDDDEQWMSLRYDLTAPLARFVAENFDALPKPFRRYQVGSVWRNEKPGPGRYRQFTQCDADTVGAPSPHADVEAVAMMAEALEAAGVAASSFLIRVNDRNALTGLLETIGVAEDAPNKLVVMRAMDKFDRLGEAGVAALLGPGRKDESGDFTPGAKLDDRAIANVLAFMRAKGATNEATCAALSNIVGGAPAGARGVETLSAIATQLTALGYGGDRIEIDPSVVRGLDYYTGPVFEAEFLPPTLDEKGRPMRFGSIAGGGRYDGLVARFKGIEVPAVGFSIGVSRLLAALESQGARPPQRGPVVVLALDAGRMADYQAMASELRAAGIRAEVYYGGSGMRAQLKYADKRAAPVVVIEGEDERAQGQVTLKDLALGAEMSKTIEDNAEWRAAKPAQIAAPRARLVAEVKAMLARLPA